MQLTQEQTKILKANWGFDKEIKFHQQSANSVYYAQINSQDVVLRLTESGHRSISEIHSELDWMNYLSLHGLQVAKPIPTFSNQFIAEIPGNTTYYATIFQKAKGSFLGEDVALSQGTIEMWGRYLGAMHKTTKNYKPSMSIHPRQQWGEDETLKVAKRSFNKDDKLAYQRSHELLEWLESLPKSLNDYGLVHCDLGRWNFVVHNQQMTAFDFDDCCYHWFSYDIAASLYSLQNAIQDTNLNISISTAFSLFLNGYLKENLLEQIWLDRVEIFKKYRSMLIYHWIQTRIKEGCLKTDKQDLIKRRLSLYLENVREPLALF